LETTDLEANLPTGKWTAEQRLLLAVLQRAVRDLEEWFDDPSPTNTRWAENSFSWLISRQTGIQAWLRVSVIRGNEEIQEIMKTRSGAKKLQEKNGKSLIEWEAHGVTFDYICRALGVDPFSLRLRLEDKVRKTWAARSEEMEKKKDTPGGTEADLLAGEKFPAI
jgi:hypothetical protein